MFALFVVSDLLRAMKHYNDASPHDKISQQQLIATLKKGVRKGAQSERFAAALLTMKYKVKNPEFHTSGLPEIQDSGSPYFWMCGIPEFGIS